MKTEETNFMYFGDTYIGEIIDIEYNSFLKRNTIVIRTFSGCMTRVGDPRESKDKTNWRIAKTKQHES